MSLEFLCNMLIPELPVKVFGKLPGEKEAHELDEFLAGEVHTRKYRNNRISSYKFHPEYIVMVVEF